MENHWMPLSCLWSWQSSMESMSSGIVMSPIFCIIRSSLVCFSSRTILKNWMPYRSPSTRQPTSSRGQQASPPMISIVTTASTRISRTRSMRLLFLWRKEESEKNLMRLNSQMRYRSVARRRMMRSSRGRVECEEQRSMSTTAPERRSCSRLKQKQQRVVLKRRQKECSYNMCTITVDRQQTY